ncbi:MAG: hypoxanthine phosphoribosyltransferase [Verrucomicrobiae bacterium]|nr:hypoxanthine phosphoribosyltransferase [Verrucomicrobiae bacterium]
MNVYVINENRRLKPPSKWRGEIDFVLIRQQEISRRVKQLALQLQKDYEGRELVIIALLSGTVVFLADLVRCLDLTLKLDFLGMSSYGSETIAKEITITKEIKFEINGKDVLILDDILDTGKTLRATVEKLGKLNPNSLKTCVLLDKPSRRVVNISADYVGFEIPDFFVVGYGLDFAERFRNLPFIAVLKKEIYENGF